MIPREIIFEISSVFSLNITIIARCIYANLHDSIKLIRNI